MKDTGEFQRAALTGRAQCHDQIKGTEIIAPFLHLIKGAHLVTGQLDTELLADGNAKAINIEITFHSGGLHIRV